MSFTAEEIVERQRYIGGSDAAPALGMSKWKQARELYMEKRGEWLPSHEESEAMRWGRLLEPVVRQEYAQRTQRTVLVPTHPIVSDKYPFMRVTPDGITEDKRLFEAKTARIGDAWGEQGSDEVPREYLLQCQHSMVVLNLEVADIGVLVGWCDFRQYEIPADRELQEMIIDGEADFARRVREADPPPVDFTAATATALIKRLYPGTNGVSMNATSEHVEWRAEMDRNAAIVKEAGTKAAEMKSRLLHAMGDCASLVFADGKAYRRKLVEKKAYEVKSTSYIDARFVAA